ncbi:hypothetical protein D9M71_649880 [compost metagenome]
MTKGPGLPGDHSPHDLERVVDDQHGRIGVIQGIDDLGDAPARIDRVQYTVAPGYAQAVLDILLGVARQHGDAVPAGHAEFLQCAGQPGDTLAELGERHAAPLAANGSGIGALLHVAV